MDFPIVKLEAETLTQSQFDQLFLLEQDCGLDPYPPEVLLECVMDLETYACFDGDKMLGFITVHYSSRYFGGSLYIVNLNVRRSARCGTALRRAGRGHARLAESRAAGAERVFCGAKSVSHPVRRGV